MEPKTEPCAWCEDFPDVHTMEDNDEALVEHCCDFQIADAMPLNMWNRFQEAIIAALREAFEAGYSRCCNVGIVRDEMDAEYREWQRSKEAK